MSWEPGIKYSDLANNLYLYSISTYFKLFWNFQLNPEHFDNSISRFKSLKSLSWRVSDEMDGDKREAKERGQKGGGRGCKNSKYISLANIDEKNSLQMERKEK